MKANAALPKNRRHEHSGSPASKKRNPAAITVLAQSPNDLDAAYARTLTRPTVQAATTIYAYEGIEKHGRDINALVDEMATQVNLVADGDMNRCNAMLVTQAHTLDEIFNNLARRARANMEAGYMNAADTYLRLALKAQSQCRTTIEALSEIKNPRPVSFVRQANIAAGPQQVNNGAFRLPVDASRARKEENEPNKLLEQTNGKWLDIGTTSPASTANPDLATVGEVHRTEHGERQTDRKQERV